MENPNLPPPVQPVSLAQPPTPATSQQEQALISDFSAMFKDKKPLAKKPSMKPKLAESKPPHWLLQIPTKLQITIEDVQARRVMDMRKWMSIAKTDRGCRKLTAAVCSGWNYLFSEKGLGKEKMLTVAGLEGICREEFDFESLREEDEGSRLDQIRKLVQAVNKYTGSNLQVQVACKLAPPNKLQQSPEDQLKALLQGIGGNSSAYIYLAYRDIFYPMGFDRTFLTPLDAYALLQNVPEDKQQLWIVNSSLGRAEPTFCIKRWSDMQKDMETVWPQYMDIKEVKQGRRIRPDASQQNKGKDRESSSCILRLFRA